MTAIYRLYTEDRANLLQLVARHFTGANLQHVDGLWNGTIERGAVVEIIGTVSDAREVAALAETIVTENEQSEVLIVRLSSQEITPLVVYGPTSPLFGRGASLQASNLAAFTEVAHA